MMEQHLKSFAEEFDFQFNHLNKIVACDLFPPFSIQYKEKRLILSGQLPVINNDKKEDAYLKIMQLNLALESVESLNIGLSADEKLMLHAEINFSLNYKQIKMLIESFANHLDKISSMLQDLNKEK